MSSHECVCWRYRLCLFLQFVRFNFGTLPTGWDFVCFILFMLIILYELSIVIFISLEWWSTAHTFRLLRYYSVNCNHLLTLLWYHSYHNYDTIMCGLKMYHESLQICFTMSVYLFVSSRYRYQEEIIKIP